MELPDFDWRAGELLVHGKAGRRERLPLAHDVGVAIVAYLRNGRPQAPSRARWSCVAMRRGKRCRSRQSAASSMQLEIERACLTSARIGCATAQPASCWQQERACPRSAKHYGNDRSPRPRSTPRLTAPGWPSSPARGRGAYDERAGRDSRRLPHTAPFAGLQALVHERLLGQFLDFLAEREEPTITTELAIAWASWPSGASPGWIAQRLSTVRAFATFVAGIAERTQVPPVGCLPGGPRRAVPYLYTDAEVEAIMAVGDDEIRSMTPGVVAGSSPTFDNPIELRSRSAGFVVEMHRSSMRWHAGAGYRSIVAALMASSSVIVGVVAVSLRS